MSIRKKILIYFSAVSVSLMGIAFFTIYTLFAEYREEEFQKRQKEKIELTLKFLNEIRDIDDRLIEAMDRITLNELHDEKLLIFNKHKEIIYSSIDDTPIQFPKTILEQLSRANTWLERKDGDYDVIGVFIENDNSAFYGISKAYDTFGYSKLNFLKFTLLFTFIGIAVIVVLVSFYLARKIASPITAIHEKISGYQLETAYTPISVQTSTREVSMLAEQFNLLMKRLSEAYSYQKHAINHISHELKTPIAVLVSNFERMEKETDLPTLVRLIQEQKEDTKSLGSIIDTLLEVSKVDSNRHLTRMLLRIDELIFDVIDEIKRVAPDFNFLVAYDEASVDEKDMLVPGNYALLRMAFNNLLLNCTRYSSDVSAGISIRHQPGGIRIEISNRGEVICENEREFLFRHFFRGGNSQGIRGFGLGLVFVAKVVELHYGEVSYDVRGGDTNLFIVSLPLS